MNEIISGETIGMGAIALALIGLVWKIWKEHSALTKEVTKALQQNAVANQKLSDSVRENTKVTSSTKDTMIELLYKIAKEK